MVLKIGMLDVPSSIKKDISDFTKTSCRRDLNCQSGLCWDFFLISPCVYCRWHECRLSDRTTAPDGGDFDSRRCSIFQLFDHLSGQRLVGMGRNSNFSFLRYFCIWLFGNLGSHLFYKQKPDKKTQRKIKTKTIYDAQLV